MHYSFMYLAFSLDICLTTYCCRLTNSFDISGVHKELPLEGAQADPHGREAVLLLLGRLRLEVREVRRADQAPQEAYRHETIQMPSL